MQHPAVRHYLPITANGLAIFRSIPVVARQSIQAMWVCPYKAVPITKATLPERNLWIVATMAMTLAYRKAVGNATLNSNSQ